jgi:SNF2 family DNA or RNA helicase
MKLHEYQKKAVDYIIHNKFCGLFLDMGMGKTLSVLTALNVIKTLDGELPKTLIIAPLRVASMTWPFEIGKWGFDFSISMVMGSVAKRTSALKKEAEIYITNIDNLVWIGDYWDFKIVVIDEASAFKNVTTNRFKMIKKLKYQRLIALTGTPAPNNLMELWPLMYFEPILCSGYVVFKYGLKSGAEEKIYNKISDICISMQNIVRPKVLINDILIDIPMNDYEEIESEAFMSLGNDKFVDIANAAVLVNKLSQVANGFVYDNTGEAKILHDSKLLALKDIIDEANGENVLIFAMYKADILRIVKELEAEHLKADEDFMNWNRGNISLAIAHPKSCGHGLNLQDGGRIVVWYGLTYSLECYLQANARLARQGQQKTIIINRLMARNTVDEGIKNILDGKGRGLQNLLEAIREKY